MTKVDKTFLDRRNEQVLSEPYKRPSTPPNLQQLPPRTEAFRVIKDAFTK